MRILHVVSGIAPDQRFGGVSRVALALAEEQMRAGHEVRLLSSSVGFERPLPRFVDGIPSRLSESFHLIPRLGFGTLFSPKLIWQVRRYSREADIVHVHLARELNMPLAVLAARRIYSRIVVQTHGMLDAPASRLAAAADLFLVGPAIRRAAVALTLTEEEDETVRSLSKRRTKALRFRNGIPSDVAAGSQSGRRDSVLFLARLHPRKGAIDFARAASNLAREFPDYQFDIVGPDEGDANGVKAVLTAAPRNVIYHGAVNHESVSGFMKRAVLYVLPAQEEPFGLTLLEAMAVATPVLLSESAQLAKQVIVADAGWTFGAASGHGTLEARLRTILSDETALRSRGENALQLVREKFALGAVAEDLELIYAEVRRGGS